MKRTLMLYLSIIGLFMLISSCEKDGDTVTMLVNPVPPSLNTLPDLTLERANGLTTLIFAGTPVDPGFQASATYFLEACASGNNFVDVVSLISDVQDAEMKITEGDLNGKLIKKFPTDAVSSVDFRIRSVLLVDAGTGALGTSTNPLEYVSEKVSAEVTLYGLPKLDLLNSGMDQKIESALGNGAYFGYVKLDPAMPFTLKDTDTDKEYGANGANLAENGTGIIAPSAGWFQLSANTTALTFSMDPYMIGLVGSATPNAWGSPDQKMDYNAQSGTWYITLDLIDGEIKFRKNDGWAWNLGGTPDNLTQGGANIPVTAGNYTITLTIVNDLTGTCTIVKN